MKKIGMLVVVAGMSSASFAAVIPDRASLNAILGGGGTTDNFETFNIGAGGATLLDITTLNSGSIANGQGPGLVNPGASYFSGTLQWNGDTYFGMTSRAILGNDFTIDINYSAAVTAMGVDMQAYFGFGDTAQVAVYDTSNALIYSASIAIPTDASDVFFGYESAAGIGRVVLGGTEWGWSPNIDDHTYGVPAPAGVAVFGAGALAFARRRRS